MFNIVSTPFAMAQILIGMRVQLLIPGVMHLRLFQNNFNPTPTSLIADFTEATYDGYAAVNFNASFGPSRDVDGSFEVWGGAFFAMTGSVTPNVIYGAYVTDFANANLVFATRFDAQVAMIDAFSTLSARYNLSLPVNGLLGGCEVVS